MRLIDQNILFILRATQHGGTEKVVLELCEALAPRVNKIAIASCSKGIDQKELEKLGVQHYEIPDIECKKICNIIRIRKIIKTIIKKDKITIIHTHHRMAAFYCQLIKSKGLIFINTSHTVFYNKKYLTQFAFSGMKLIACGRTVKESLVNFQGIDSQRIKVISNSVKPYNSTIIPIKEITDAINEDYIVAGFIGRLSKEKGLIHLVDAVKNIPKLKIKFFIVGAGDDEINIKKRIQKYGIEKKFCFLGYRNDAQNIAKQLDYIVLPSLQEGLPLVPIEAFSVGKPVIATNIEGTSEIIDNGVNGLLVPPGNVADLSKAISSMTKEKCIEFGENAYKKYLACFSYKVFRNEYINYYEGL